MKHIYPAYKLDELNKLYREKYRAMVNRAKELRLEYPDKEEPEREDEEYTALLAELDDIGYKFDEEHYRVICEYNELFRTHYITIEEVQTMFDLDRLYIERHIMPSVSTVYLNSIIRRYIKTAHKYHTTCELDGIIHLNDIDYEKKVFMNKAELEEWLFNHLESDDILLTEPLIKYCLQNRKNAVMHSTETTKKIYGLKYNMQLQRLELDRIYIRANSKIKKPLSRIPSDRLMAFIMNDSCL